MDEEKQKTKRFVKISLILHFSLFALLLIGNFVSPPAMLIEPTVQIDMVALPDQVKSQDNPALDPALPVKDLPPPPSQKAPEPEPDEVALPEKPEKKVHDTKKELEAEKRAKSALEKLREQMKKDKQAEAKKRQQELDQRQEDLKRFDQAYRSALKGNQTNQGTSTTGSMAATLNAYAGHITDRLRSNWNLPAYLQGKGLRASVIMYINPNGQVSRFVLKQSSGNEAFDDYVIATIKRSNPFAPPPEEMAKGLRNSGLEVLFPL